MRNYQRLMHIKWPIPSCVTLCQLCLLCLVLPYAGKAYEVEPPVHAWISYQGWLQWPGRPGTPMFQSNIKEPQDEMALFLHPFPNENALVNALFGPSKGAIPSDWGIDTTSGQSILEGNYEEDFNASPLKDAAVLNHFWNPDKRFDTGLNVLGISYDSSLVKANELWKRALCAYPTDKRLGYFLLGQVAHLLQDLSVPNHAHNDGHPSAHTCLDMFIGYHCQDDSSLEAFTAFRSNYQKCVNCKATPGLPFEALIYPFTAIPSHLELPFEYDYELCRLFYNLAQRSQRFDADDPASNGNDDGLVVWPPSPPIRGARRNRSLEVNGGRSVVPGSISVAHRGFFSSAALTPGEGNDFVESPWRGRVLLSNALSISLLDRFEISYTDDVTGLRFSETIQDLIESGDIPDDIMLRTQEVCEGQAIAFTAALYELFWRRTHYPKLGFAVEDCDVSGGDAEALGLPTGTDGGEAGSVDIRTGMHPAFEGSALTTANLGRGILGDLTTSARLTGGTYTYRQVGGLAQKEPITLTIEGDVVIQCQYGFNVSRIVGIRGNSGSPPTLHVFAGEARFFLDPPGDIPTIDRSYAGFHAVGSIEFSPPAGDNGTVAELGVDLSSEAASNKSELNGGHFIFWTTQPGPARIKQVSAFGGGGTAGGNGGKGGKVVLMAMDDSVSGAIWAGGGDAGGWRREGGEKGGDGGDVLILADKQDAASTLSIRSSGGDGADGFDGDTTRLDGRNGGDAGFGGSVRLIYNRPATTQITVKLDGGNGGRGGNGADSASQSGGKGGRGGQGGSGGRIESTITSLISLSALPGLGGAGGNGGTSTGYAGGDGGSGGNVFSGGRTGKPGLGGASFDLNFNVVEALHGNDGGNGVVQDAPSQEIPSIPMVTSPCSSSKSMLARIVTVIFTPSQQGASIRFVIEGDNGEMKVEVSNDLKTWSWLADVIPSNGIVSFVDPLWGKVPARFYRLILK